MNLMRHSVLALLFLTASALVSFSVSEATGQKVELPADGNKVVLRLDVRRPARIEPPKTNPLAKKDDSKEGDGKKQDGGKGKDGKQDGKDGSGDKTGKTNSGQSRPWNSPLDNGKLGLQEPTKIPQVNVTVPQNRFVIATQPDEPLIEIYADGRVKCGRIVQGSISATSKLTEDQLQELMQFVVNEQKYFEIDSSELDEKIKSTESLNPATLSKYTFTVATRDQEKQLTMTGVRVLQKTFSKIDALQRAAAIHQRLNQLFVTINVGGQQNMITILKSINEHLKQKNKNAPEFGINDATFIAVSPQGTMRLTFGKSVFDEKGQQIHRYVATYQYSGGKTAKVSIYGY